MAKKSEEKLQAGHCNKCGADIYWIKTEKGANMPANRKLLTIITLKEGKVFKGYEPHWVDCPRGHEFRGK
jgi:hypothetical protein